MYEPGIALRVSRQQIMANTRYRTCLHAIGSACTYTCRTT